MPSLIEPGVIDTVGPFTKERLDLSGGVVLLIPFADGPAIIAGRTAAKARDIAKSPGALIRLDAGGLRRLAGRLLAYAHDLDKTGHGARLTREGLLGFRRAQPEEVI